PVRVARSLSVHSERISAARRLASSKSNFGPNCTILLPFPASEFFGEINVYRAALRLRVRAAFFAEAERSALDREAEAVPPSLPPFFAGALLAVLPRPEPPAFLPPWVMALTVAQARRSASFLDVPRSS